MKTECIKEKLTVAVAQAEKIAGRNLTLPVLSCVLLEATKNSLIIRSTNLDLGIEITIPAKTSTEGKVAVPGNILSSFLNNTPYENNITLETTDTGVLKIITSKTSTSIKSVPSDDFPSIPEVSDEQSFKIKASDFVKGLKSVWYSSSVSSIKPELSSVLVKCEDDTLVCAATDSFRLAEKRVKLKDQRPFENILIPFKNVQEIIKVLDAAKEDVLLFVTKNQISVSYEGVYLTSRVIDGVFPDYQQIIPKESLTEVTLLKDDLIQSFKIANIFSDKFNQINLRAEPSKKNFEVKTSNADLGESVNKVDASFKGEDVAVNFNHKYVTDCFGTLSTDSVSLSFNGLNKPLVIRGVGDSSFLYLVMPMNR